MISKRVKKAGMKCSTVYKLKLKHDAQAGHTKNNGYPFSGTAAALLQ